VIVVAILALPDLLHFLCVLDVVFILIRQEHVKGVVGVASLTIAYRIGSDKRIYPNQTGAYRLGGYSMT
jgi:hypothetical protein